MYILWHTDQIFSKTVTLRSLMYDSYLINQGNQKQTKLKKKKSDRPGKNLLNYHKKEETYLCAGTNGI